MRFIGPAILSAGLALSGCASDPGEVNTGLDAMAGGGPSQGRTPSPPDPQTLEPAPGTIESLLHQTLVDLESIGQSPPPDPRVDQLASAAPASPRRSLPIDDPAGAVPADAPSRGGDAPELPGPDAAVQIGPDDGDAETATRPSRPAPPDAGARLREEIERFIHQTPDETALIRLIRMAMADAALGQIDDKPPPSLEPLAEPEQQILAAAHRLAEGLVGPAAADPDAVMELLRSAADDLEALHQIRIRDVALCRSVAGFGKYAPFASNTFLAGRAHRMIVYTEVDRFAHRSPTAEDRVSPGDQWVVELEQSMELYPLGDATPVWKLEPRTIRDASRRKRRDFYLVGDVSLPANLTVGSYVLKVIVRDVVTSAQQAKTAELSIVADPALIDR